MKTSLSKMTVQEVVDICNARHTCTGSGTYREDTCELYNKASASCCFYRHPSNWQLLPNMTTREMSLVCVLKDAGFVRIRKNRDTVTVADADEQHVYTCPGVLFPSLAAGETIFLSGTKKLDEEDISESIF